MNGRTVGVFRRMCGLAGSPPYRTCTSIEIAQRPSRQRTVAASLLEMVENCRPVTVIFLIWNGSSHEFPFILNGPYV